MLLERNDGGDYIQGIEALVEMFDFLLDDVLSTGSFLLSIGSVRDNHGLQVINVIDEDAVELGHRGIDVAGYGDIDEEHWLVFALLQEHLAVLTAEDVVRCAGGGNNDV